MRAALLITSAALSLGAATLLVAGQTATATCLAVSALLVFLLLPSGKRRAGTDRSPIDVDHVRQVREQRGRVAAVREVRRQESGLSMLEATRTVDALHPGPRD